jgi:predicted nucleic acid-binding protein
MVVDASVWVSALVATETHHAESCRWLSNRMAAGNSMIAPVLLLPEVVCAIARRTMLPELGVRAAQAILRSGALRLVGLDVALGEEAALLGARLRLRGADSVYVAVGISHSPGHLGPRARDAGCCSRADVDPLSVRHVQESGASCRCSHAVLAT